MNRSGAEIHRSESQSKVIQDRVNNIEQHLGQICDITSSYTRKTARLRDKGDILAKELMGFSEYEKWNPTLSSGMARFAESLSAIQDYREAEVKRLEGKIITPLVNYGLLCKQTKNDLKSSFAARDREMSQKKKLEILKNKSPGDRQKILESELQRASLDASRSSKALEQQIDKFEERKLKDLKKIMREFVTIEMHFHGKALELYTQCFQTLDQIDPDSDLEEFRRQIRPEGSIRSDIARSASQASLESKQNSSGNNTPRKLTAKPATPPPTNNRKMVSLPNPQDLEDDSDDEDDDEDNDDDDDDDYEDEDETETDKAPPRK